MDLSLSWEQQQLKDTLGKLVGAIKPGADWRATWAQLADLGVLGLPISEQSGGAGGSAVDTLVVQEALGRGPVVSPYLAAVVLAGSLLDLAASEEQRARLLPGLADGTALPILAHGERAARYDLAHVATNAVKRGENSGRTLRHAFAALRLESAALREGRATVALPPRTDLNVTRHAAAAWITRRGSLTPLQAVGGWIE